MALTQSSTDDRIEIVGPYRSINVRTSTVVLDGNTQIAQSYSRRVLEPREMYDGAWRDTDISHESEYVQSICGAAWTASIRSAYEAGSSATP